MANKKEFRRISWPVLVGSATSAYRPRPCFFTKPAICRVLCVGILIVGGIVGPDRCLRAEPPLRSPFSGESLRRTSVTLTVENQAFGEVLHQVVQSVNLGSKGRPGSRPWSLWLDRRVDPTQKVAVSAAALPATQVILKVVEPLELAAYPLPGVLLVGRPEWVEATLASLPSPIAISRRSGNPSNPEWEETSGGRQGDVGDDDDHDRVSVRWPTGTTAAEALAIIVTGKNQSELVADDLPDWMPHDIWGQGELRSVDRTLASALVLAQFDLSLRRSKSLQSLLTQSSVTQRSKTLSPSDSKSRFPGDPTTSLAFSASLPPTVQRWKWEPKREATLATEFSQAYPSGDAALPIREALKEQTTRSTVRASGDSIVVRTVARNHLVALKTLWNVAAASPPRSASDPTESVFDLKIVNKPVADVLRQLAAAAGMKIEFQAGTELASERLVSLDAIKKTLPELAQEVATQVGLMVTWGAAEVVIGNPASDLPPHDR